MTAVDLLSASICRCGNPPVAMLLRAACLALKLLVSLSSRLILRHAFVSIAGRILFFFILRRFRIGFFPFFAFAAEDHFSQTQKRRLLVLQLSYQIQQGSQEPRDDFLVLIGQFVLLEFLDQSIYFCGINFWNLVGFGHAFSLYFLRHVQGIADSLSYSALHCQQFFAMHKSRSYSRTFAARVHCNSITPQKCV